MVTQNDPKLAPCTVTDAEAVPAWLLLRNELTLPISIEIASLKLPERLPAVNTNLFVLRKLEPARHRTEESPAQLVTSQLVYP